MPEPEGPVTLHSKVAGIIILLSGLAGAAFLAPVGFLSVIFARSVLEVIGIVIFCFGILVIAMVVLAGAIGVLRGKSWGRSIGIVSSLSLGAVFLATELVSPDGLVFWLPVGLYAYSAIVLILRWRRPGPA